jgi:hypothetical protein
MEPAIRRHIDPAQRLEQSQGYLEVTGIGSELIAKFRGIRRPTFQSREEPAVSASEHNRNNDEAVSISVQYVQHQIRSRLVSGLNLDGDDVATGLNATCKTPGMNVLPQ